MRLSGTRPVTACIYRHQFRDGPGGWLGWASNTAGAKALAIDKGAAISTRPWWIDYNHAPPGGGYLNILFALHTVHGPNFPKQFKNVGGLNTFVAGGFPLDFTDARLTVEICGHLNPRGAHLVTARASESRRALSESRSGVTARHRRARNGREPV